jgi:predicted ATPase
LTSMKLTSAHIRHYKSLDDVQIDFDERLTVLVGPNAAGKSNVVDSLRFVRDAIANDIQHAVSMRGGMSRVRQHSKSKQFRLVMQLEFSQPDSVQDGGSTRYAFSVESTTASKYIVVHDGISAESPLAAFMRSWQFSSIYPNRLREPSTPANDIALAEDGRNWASVIKSLRRTPKGRLALHRIIDAMRDIIPTFEEVSVASVGSYLVPNFKFTLKGKDAVSFDPVQLSDGTLRVFGILLALYQLPAPKLLVIEDPEQTVQPGVMAVLAEAITEASEETQLIITTHSPSLIDHFKPEQVRVVTLEDGLTKVSRVKKTQIEAVKRDLMSMQDFMLAEGLQPELP